MGRRDENHLRQDLKTGICLGLGYSHQRAGEVAGTSKGTVENHRDCALTREFEEFTRAVSQARIADAIESSKDAWLKELRKRRGKHLDLADKLIAKAEAEGADPDLILKAMKASGDLVDRDPETMRGQKMEHGGEIVERKVLELPRELISVWIDVVREAKQLPPAEEDVIDVTPE